MLRLTGDGMKSSKEGTGLDLDKWFDAEEQPQTSSASSSDLRQVIKTKTQQDAPPKPSRVSLLQSSEKIGNYFRKLILLKLEDGDDVREHIYMFFFLVDKLMELDFLIDEDVLCALLLSSFPTNFEEAIAPTGILPNLETLTMKIIQEGDAKCDHDFNADSIDVKIKKDTYLEEVIERYKCKQSKDDEDEDQEESKNYGDSEPEEGAFFRLKSKNDDCSFPEGIEDKFVWYLDSGCSAHMCNDVSKFRDFKKCEKKIVRLANGQPREIIGTGTIIIRPRLAFRGACDNLKIKDVYCVPDLRINLISISKIADEGKKVIFDETCARIIDQDDQEMAKGHRNNGLYYIEEDPSIKDITKYKIDNKILEWHNKLCHLNIRDMRELFKSDILKHTDIDYFPNDFLCKVCEEEKVKNQPFLRSESVTAKRLLEIIHIGICGPVEVPSLGENTYFVTFTDDLSRYAEVYFIKEKSEVFGKFIEFKIYMETILNYKIKCLRSECGAEYQTNEFDDFLKYSGIRRCCRPQWRYPKHQTSVSEEKNRTLLDAARCLLSQSGLPIYFWAEAINTANFIRNRCPSAVIDFKTPYEVVFGKKPNLSYIKTFGSMGFALIGGGKSKNFEQKSIRCIFLGYSFEKRGFRVYIPELNQLEILKNVKVVDGIFVKECKDLQELV